MTPKRFLKLLVVASWCSWRAWEFWALTAMFSLLAMTGNAPVGRRALCVVLLVAGMTVLAAAVSTRRVIVDGKIRPEDIDGYWTRTFGRGKA